MKLSRESLAWGLMRLVGGTALGTLSVAMLRLLWSTLREPARHVSGLTSFAIKLSALMTLGLFGALLLAGALCALLPPLADLILQPPASVLALCPCCGRTGSPGQRCAVCVLPEPMPGPGWLSQKLEWARFVVFGVLGVCLLFFAPLLASFGASSLLPLWIQGGFVLLTLGIVVTAFVLLRKVWRMRPSPGTPQASFYASWRNETLFAEAYVEHGRVVEAHGQRMHSVPLAPTEVSSRPDLAPTQRAFLRLLSGLRSDRWVQLKEVHWVRWHSLIVLSSQSTMEDLLTQPSATHRQEESAIELEVEPSPPGASLAEKPLDLLRQIDAPASAGPFVEALFHELGSPHDTRVDWGTTRASFDALVRELESMPDSPELDPLASALAERLS